jgi:hypothetical protein
VASQFSNMLTVLDLDPNGDSSAADAAVAGRVFLANGQPGGARVTDGVGGEGVKPLPTPYDGWIQDSVAAQFRTVTPCSVTSSEEGTLLEASWRSSSAMRSSAIRARPHASVPGRRPGSGTA